MDYLTVKEVGNKWGITSRMVNAYCIAGRISGAVKVGNLWLIPKEADRPEDRRKKGNRLMDPRRKADR
ncbi:MAG: DNA-binding protein [Lachnospiraceae bacterium]|nr:DNA-binding protein [Lachnospiraceae bacterium]